MSEPDETPVTIRMLEREIHANGNSVAFSLARNEDYVWLNYVDIIIEFTGEIETECKVAMVTMPMWKAQVKGLT